MNMNEILEAHDGSIENLTIDYLDMFEYKERTELLPKLLHKMRKGGNISIIGYDLNVISRLLINDLMTLEIYNDIIKGIKSMESMLKIERVLMDSGFKLTKRGFLEHGKYFLTAIN